MRKSRGATKARLAVAAAAALAILAGATGAGAAPAGKWKATPLTPTGQVEGAKSETARMAQTDRSLLGRSSSKPVNVVVKLDYDSLSVYGGQIKGLPATAPRVTGRALDPRSTAYRRYSGYVQDREQRFRSALNASIPVADTGTPLRDVYGGMALTLPANRIPRLLKLPGVVAVQRDALEQPQTDSSAAFIGAPTLYGQLGQTAADAGKGVIVGVLDTGAWPEHPSFADPGTLPAPPAKADGSPRTCAFGDNPVTPANDPFVCTRKLIGGRAFLETYLSDPSRAAAEMYHGPRDSDGHGTHTASTAAGRPVADATPLGISRGAIQGIAPGAHVAAYKVCGVDGCFPSDSAAAIGQAILDGVNVINFSIGGGPDPYTDVVDLAFLDAYAAGIVVSTSAGNSGPGPATTNHNAPWQLAVAASTQPRTFRSTVTLAAAGETLQLSGVTLTSGVSALPVVDAASPPYSNAGCVSPAPAGLFAGKIVVCRNAGLPVQSSHNVQQGGAAGMILANQTASELRADNHWVPTLHLAASDGQQLLAFLSTHPATTASWPQGSKTTWQGDRLAGFSSRGPGTDWIKPDLAAPGVHILAGMTPTPESTTLGPPGNVFRVINGTSMAAPHVTGSAALVKALHPNWTPGQIMSALKTTAKPSGVTKSDGTTPADPFDAGSGRIDLTKAGDPGLTFDETAANYTASAGTPLNRIDLNTPSVSAPTMPGVITTTRTAKNVTNTSLTFGVTTSAPSGVAIVVTPSRFTVKPGASVKLGIAVAAPSVANGQYFGRINLAQTGGPRTLRLPVAFVKKQGIVSLTQDCAPASIRINTGRSTCTVTAHNESLSSTRFQMASATGSELQVTEATGATRLGSRLVAKTGTLGGRRPAAPTVAPTGEPPRYLPLDTVGVEPIPIGDEEALTFTTPSFVFAGQTYTSLDVTSNGYIVAGGTGNPADLTFMPQALPDPARPNSVLAPYWTDLDGAGAPGVFIAVLNDGPNQWLVVEWRLKLFETNTPRTFQIWIGIDGTEDIRFAYDPANLAGPPNPGSGLTVGAENAEGVGGATLAPPQDEVAPTGDLRVSSTAATPGGTATYTFKVKGVSRGSGLVGTEMTTPLVRGITTETDSIAVTP